MEVAISNFINLSNKIAECKISLFGGNLISYRPKSEEHDMFWLGDFNKVDNVQAIRGGVPICWPRFGEEKLNSEFPRHGFARIQNWEVDRLLVEGNRIEAKLLLVPDAKYVNIRNINLTATLSIIVTDKLEYILETTNNGNEVAEFSEALHAYFNVGSVEDIIIKGLSNHQYESSLDGKIYTLEKDLKINQEFDANFLNHRGAIEIVDPVLNRTIVIEKEGSNTTVVWNPYKDYIEMSKEQYKKFICIEPANQGDCFVTLKPKEKHKISMKVYIK